MSTFLTFLWSVLLQQILDSFKAGWPKYLSKASHLIKTSPFYFILTLLLPTWKKWLIEIRILCARKFSYSFDKGINNSIHAIHWCISLSDLEVKFARLLQRLGSDLLIWLRCNEKINKVRSQKSWYNYLVLTILLLIYKLTMGNKLKWLPKISHYEWISKDGIIEKISYSLLILKLFKYYYLLSHGKILKHYYSKLVINNV